MTTFEYTGILTAGYYNDMENGYPVFIDGISLSDIVKELLTERGIDDDFCYRPFEGPDNVSHPLIGKRAHLVLEIEE